MIQLKKNVWVENDDNKVLQLISQLRQRGAGIPEIDPKIKKDQYVFAVNYDTGFDLYIIAYLSKINDSGYIAVHIKNFLTENRFNLNDFARFGFDIAAALASIYSQVMGIADKINYPFTIASVIDKNFIGLIAEPIIDCN